MKVNKIGVICEIVDLISLSEIEEARRVIATGVDGTFIHAFDEPSVKPEHFLKKRLWQARIFDHLIRNDSDPHENLEYIALNPVREGYVTQAQFYP